MKNQIVYLLVGPIFTFLTLCAYGQEVLENGLIPIIEVTGIAEQEVIPDEIYLGITIKEQTIEKELISIATQEQQLKTIVKELSIPLENLMLADTEGSLVRIKRKKFNTIVSNEYVLKVDNAALATAVFNNLDSLNINDFRVIRTNHSKLDSIQKANRIVAIQAAKTKADYLLNAIGEETGRAIYVKENALLNGEYTSQLNVRGARSVSEYFIDGVKVRGSENETIEFRKIKIQSSVYVKFEIKQKN